MRVEPFTSMHIEMQSGKFDHAARQFSSIPDTFRMVNTHLNDFRELVPEFFFTKVFLINENKFDLGFANNTQINDVMLPKWAHNDPLLFIYYNRKALESEIVSEHLNEWIDLIWGYKQRGKEAYEADNTYDPSIYSDIWTEETLKDEDKRSLINETMTHCGQIPDQLFLSPHPKRQPNNDKIKSVQYACFSTSLEYILGDDHILFGTIRQLEKGISNLDYSSKFEFIILTSSCKFIDIIIKTASEMDDNNISIESVQLLNKVNIPYLEEATSFAMFSFDEIAFGTPSGKIIIVDAKRSSICASRPHEGIVNCIAASSPFVVSGGADTVISCVKKNIKFEHSQELGNLQRVHSMPAYSSEVVCTTISKEFHAIAAGTSGGLVIIKSLENNDVTCVIELNKNRLPYHMLITKGWGFVVVCTVQTSQSDAELTTSDHESNHEMFVYSLCGELIGYKNMENKVSRILS